MTWFPMHSWHPLVIHVPLVGLLFAVLFDLVAVQSRSTRWRDAATAQPCSRCRFGAVDHSYLALATAILARRRDLGLVGALGLAGAGVLSRIPRWYTNTDSTYPTPVWALPRPQPMNGELP